MLTFQDGTFGRIECALDLAALYSSGSERDRFEARWPDFLASDPETSRVYHRDGDTLRYGTESLRPSEPFRFHISLLKQHL